MLQCNNPPVGSYWDRAVREAPESWRSLRSRRARVPAAAEDTPNRAETFRSSLEQAEQQFRAAAVVGYESRPLNLFYGLSQAGRAIAAASRQFAEDDWQLRGHGITCSNLDEPWTSITDLVVSPQKEAKWTSSFFGVSKSLGSTLLLRNTEVANIIPLLFESSLQKPFGNQDYASLIVTGSPRVYPIGNGPFGRVEARFELPTSLKSRPFEHREKFGDFVARFPSLRSVDLGLPTGLPGVNGWPEGDELRMSWDLVDPTGSQGMAPPFAQVYRGHLMLFPELPHYTGVLHPLMAWWITLYALSMAARYAPAQWTSTIDVNSSESATSRIRPRRCPRCRTRLGR